MTDSWKLSGAVSRVGAQDALDRHAQDDGWDPHIVLTAHEIAEARPEEWMLEAWLPRRPSTADKRAINALFAVDPPRFKVEKLPPTDWVSLSQQGVEPIRAGRFHIHTPDHGADPAAVNFEIPASQAFGTGQHATTAGCLAMLDRMKREGVIVRNHADIGTGTGLLAFAAMHLWPMAYATASDIDPVCFEVILSNAHSNDVPLGEGPGALMPTIADGMDDPLLSSRGPYDLLIANILAGPLVALAPEFAAATAPGGHVVLAGLLETQENEVRAAYRRQGMRLARRLVKGDWSILWLRNSRIR
ncbi:50S ribosomal protein L11 methyltransferase [Erythrobacter sp. QSSC1-22B]|uniref:50S ribosomal protein L11 methyltransferase n=1 Tax=Erythrobacter sp. QSSC1-22B TaxID=1860125 RepID=UPI000AD7E5B4|nr:50S ribosomal protein L11 methyltransferase [Erythrobacter sp. QSSC1-22B]